MADSASNSPSLKSRIRDGETLVGVSVPMNSDRDQLQSILDQGPYDWVSVDSQHSAYHEDRLVSFCQMAAELGIHVQFRIKHTRHSYLIGNYLDLGPSGVEVPQVELESTAQEALDNFYYSPSGVRSWGGAARLGIDERPERLEYAEWWAETGVLWLQLESVHAVTEARRLAIPGVDCLSFGPADLTFSIEAHPNHPFKAVDDCVAYVVKELEGSDAVVCFRNMDPKLRRKYQDMGVTMLLEIPHA